MAARITDDEWDELTPENFDTTALLRAVDAVDVLRGDLNDSADGAPPQLRRPVEAASTGNGRVQRGITQPSG